MSTATYTAKDITVLEGLEPVRRRPSMYIGGVDSKGLHHLVWEIVDNDVDEYLNGFGDAITVILHKNGDAITVSDIGRGGFEWQMTFKRGKTAGPLEKLNPFRGHGTIIYFEPDPDIFKTTQFDP